MFRTNLRKLAGNFGYDIVKTENFEFGKRFKKYSSDPDLDYYETSVGNYFLPKDCNGDNVANTIKRGLVFDEAIYDEAIRYIRPNSTILDVGANFGQMSIEFSNAAPNVEVHAFEAQARVFDVLQKNISANKVTNVQTYYNAVYYCDGLDMFFPEADLRRFSSFGSYGLDLQAKTGKPVRSITIDSLDFALPVSFMKIDIQGSDLAAMRGAVKTIQKYQMPIIFEYEEEFQADFNTCFQDYLDFVNSIGYRFIKTIQDINFLILPR